MKKISLVVPCYKATKWAPKLIDSLMSQPGISDTEIICVNDGSPDNTGEVLDELAKKYPQIKVVHQKNGGPAVARNTGLDNASGDYIWFVDADDIVNPGSIELLINEIQKEPSDVICFNFQEIDMKDNVLNGIKDYNYKYGQTTDGVTAYAENSIPAYLWNRIIKRDLIEKNKIRFGIIPEDEDLLFHTYFEANTFRFISNVIYKYRIMDVSFGKNTNSHIKYYWGYYEIMEKYISIYPSVNDKSFWSAFLLTCLTNIFTNYNKVKVIDSKAIDVTRSEVYKSQKHSIKSFHDKIEYKGKKGFLLWMMIHMPFFIDFVVYLRYKFK
ncbi:MAG: glycosyltransferase [Bacteroidales bacterium]|nr:glycosyltransferase [Bacteroidales bacterium]